ncbi:MAG: DUF6766 family protein [Chitinophagaceae bacterium]
MRRFLRENGLSVAFILLFLVSLAGQVVTGFHEYNKERKDEHHLAPVALQTYLGSGHFIQATFENWESEFLQMALFIVLTISLRQKGSSESKKFEPEEVDRAPSARRKNVPWPVKKGGLVLQLYKHSLSIVLFLLFLVSFCLHFYGSLKDENEKLLLGGLPPQGPGSYLTSPRFWFESFQNWQSEFLSVFAIVVLSIFLRQKGSPQSKPVDAPNAETGE